MSISTGTNFRETLVLCWSLDCYLMNPPEDLSQDDIEKAADMLEYFRSELWRVYPDECEVHLDQRVNNKEPFSITLLPEDVIAENLANKERGD